MAMFNSRFLWTEVAVVATIYLGLVYCEKEPLVPKCPSPNSPAGEESTAYCECATSVTRHGHKATIKCDFNNTEDVVLTEAFYPFRNRTQRIGHVRVVNASRVHVTSAFWMELLLTNTIYLEVWRVRTLILDSVPEHDNFQQFKDYMYWTFGDYMSKTFVGIDIISCFVPEVPKNLLRDRTEGGLRIRSSHVGNFHEGVFNNIEETRYLLFEDSRVDLVEGSIAREGYLTFSELWPENVGWNGFVISNVTIDTISSNAFNLTQKVNMGMAMVMNSRIGSMKTNGLVIAGDIDVTIQDNVFGRMEKEALKVAVTGDVIFDKNIIESWEPDALKGLICHSRTSMENNTFHIDKPMDTAINISVTPFHTSCGNPQFSIMMGPQHPLSITVSTTPSWRIGVGLLIVIIVVVVGAVYAHY